MTGSVLNPICRGLVGYISFLAPCTASTVYTEYLLYEPFYRIATSQGYTVRAEVPVPEGVRRRGDHKRIDFILQSTTDTIAIELKWIKSRRPNITKDVEKLRSYNERISSCRGYVLIFGKYSDVSRMTPVYLGARLDKADKAVNWDSGRTHYACTWLRFA